MCARPGPLSVGADIIRPSFWNRIKFLGVGKGRYLIGPLYQGANGYEEISPAGGTERRNNFALRGRNGDGFACRRPTLPMSARRYKLHIPRPDLAVRPRSFRCTSSPNRTHIRWASVWVGATGGRRLEKHCVFLCRLPYPLCLASLDISP